MQETAGEGAIVEVAPVDLHKEAVDHLVRPEAVHSQGHLVGAVCKSLIDPAEGDSTVYCDLMIVDKYGFLCNSVRET